MLSRKEEALANNVDRYDVDMEKKASPYLNALGSALSEGKKRALNELNQANTFLNKIFNRKKINQLSEKVKLYNYCENQVRSSDFRSKFSKIEILAGRESQININVFGERIETALGSYFKEQGENLTPGNSLEAYDELYRTMVNSQTFSSLRGNNFTGRSEQDTSLMGFISSQNEYQNYVADYRESKPIHQIFPDQFKEGMLENESKLYINEYTKHLALVHDENRSMLKNESPDYAVIKELEGEIRSNFSKDPEYPVILLRTMAADNLNKQIATAVNMTNSFINDFSKEMKIKQVPWPTTVPEPLTYEQYNQNKSKYLEQLSKDDVLMKKNEKDLSTERELENKGTEKRKVEVQIKKPSNLKGSRKVKGLER